MKNFLNSYRRRYSISPLDLADSAETNRLHILSISPIFFAFGVGDLILITVLQIIRGGQHLSSFIYFGIFTLQSIYMFVHAVLVKNIAREKAYIWKTIPFYMCYWLGILSSVYNFYMLKQPFNGVISFCLTGFISLCLFSFSPVSFLLGLILGASLMAPGVYAHFGLTGLLDTILAAVLMFCLSLYKRRTEKNFLMLLKRQKKSLEAHTFGNFTLMYEGKVVKFSRTKSLEMIAYLVCKNGSSVNTRELLSVLWGEKADSARYGASFRNLVVDIKKTLGELEIQNFFVAEYNNFRINPEAVKCDYYDCLSGDKKACKGFTGEFMNQYSWAEDTAAFLERRILSRV